jgi:hypothetical protein
MTEKEGATMDTTEDRYSGRLHSAADLAATVRDLRPDADPNTITADWSATQMHDLGITRYEDVTAEVIDAICNRVG